MAYRAILVGWLSLLVLSGTAGGASAEESKEDELIRRAVDLRRVGDDQAALPLLEQAYAVGRSPRAAAQLGLCKQALGSWPDAETYLSESLRGDADPWVKKNRPTLEQSLLTVKGRIGRLEITGEPPQAEVLVNGNSVGNLPLSAPVRVPAGEVQVELRAPGFVRGGRTVRVDGGQYQKLAIQLERESNAQPVTTAADGAALAAAGAAAGGSTTGSTTGISTTPDSTGPRAGGWRPAVKWTAWGVAAVALGVGVFGAVRNHNLVQDFDDGCWIDNGTIRLDPGTTKTTGDCSDLKSRYESASTLGIVGFASAAAFAAAGLVVWLTDPEHRRDGTTTAVACVPQLTAGRTPQLSCLVRF